MKKGRVLLIGAGAGALALALVYLVFGPASGKFRGDTGDASVLLITVDTLRADHVGCYGYRRIATPIMDTLADTGVLFENAVTPAVMTLPSHATILSGLYPPTHGIRDNGDYRLNEGVLTLAEALRARGFRTGAVIGSFVLDSMFGLDQGFDSYDDSMPPQRENLTFFAERPARAVTDAAMRFLENSRGSRFFLWVHYYDPHHPYTAPSPFAEQHPQRGYDAEITYVDSEIGRLLASMRIAGATEKTLVVLASDHGEGLGDHGEESHGIFLYEETVRVPLILSFPPHLPSGRRVASTVSTVDLMPTILELLRIDPSSAASPVQGRSLWPLIGAGDEEPEWHPAYAEAMAPLLDHGWSPLVAIRDDRFKYIEAPEPELYDLTLDPGEKTNIASGRAELAAEYRGRLEALTAEATRPGSSADPTSLDPDAAARLRSLGYAGGVGRSSGSDPRSLPDPKSMVGTLSRINSVIIDFGAGRYRKAVADAERLLEEDPENSSVRYYMAGALTQLERFPDAIAEFEHLLERSPQDTEILCNIGWCLINMDRPDEAAGRFRQVLEIHPEHVYALASLGNIAFIEGDFAEAARLFKQVLTIEPNHLASILTLAGMAEGAGKLSEAAVVYAHATAVDPGNANTWMSLGWVQFRLGEHDQAVTSLRRAQELQPDAPQIDLALGDVQLEAGQLDAARASYEKGLQNAPDAASGYYGLGLIETKIGQADKAVALLQRAVLLNPGRAAWRRDLGRAFARVGRYESAVMEMSRYLASGEAPPEERQAILSEIETYRREGGF